MARVLIAEDDSLTRRFLLQTLEFGGHTVTAVADGIEAIVRIDSPGCFDAVITDYAMPRANGVDVIAHAQRIDPMISTIIVTAFRDLDLAMKAMQAGAVAFIPKPFKAEHLITVLGRALERRELAEETMRLRFMTPMLERFTMVLANTLESKDVATQHHANRLVAMSDAIASHLGYADDIRAAIRFGACLHDIGKVAIPELILRKPERLTAEEQAIIRTHPEVGAAIIADIDTWDDVRLIVRHHHERFDGKGYPDGLRGEDIPVGARIVAVTDAFDVMRAGRPYQPARSDEWIIEELERERGRQFDPEMVSAVIAVASAPDTSEVLDLRAGAGRHTIGRRRADVGIGSWAGEAGRLRAAGA